MLVTYLNSLIFMFMFRCRISSSYRDSAISIVNLTQSFGKAFIISFIFLNIVLFRPCFNAYIGVGE